MRFLDSAKIYVQSGHGGAGSASFRREKFIPEGGPNGGDGGRGGSVIVVATADLNTLIDYRYSQHFRAERGGHGMGANRHGKAGNDLVLKVPVGTRILAEDKETVIADLVEDGQTVTLCKGGDGGRGNTHFKTSTNRAPRRFEPGWPGEERWVWLELKLLADAGLVGLPNAGKSSFLAASSRARPKIADYPFTTMEPKLGTIVIDHEAFVLADIPGLIEGASEGAGLGDRFLGHVERCGVLIHLVDGTQSRIVQAYRTIRKELELYGHGLADKPEIVCLNKVDALTREQLRRKAKSLAEACGQDPMLISAATGENVRPVLLRAFELVKARRAAEAEARKNVLEVS
ncbi:GTPase ObgE [Geminicoccus flavidas]|uniref:GTPase ObgE n=1 Tax=Geminicoccus flavidas TaxID=2506407 RepID=UPI001358053D|nr:GTPase ObgE [Geminicoccus flavidas]